MASEKYTTDAVYERPRSSPNYEEEIWNIYRCNK